MRESRHRESRLCRVLGNPVVYQIVGLLDAQGPMSPTAIARAVGRRLQMVSGYLAALRAVELVRYERRGGRTQYWIKHGATTRRLLSAPAAFVQASSRPPD